MSTEDNIIKITRAEFFSHFHIFHHSRPNSLFITVDKHEHIILWIESISPPTYNNKTGYWKNNTEWNNTFEWYHIDKDTNAIEFLLSYYYNELAFDKNDQIFHKLSNTYNPSRMLFTVTDI
jgi:hypothetical protein